MFKKSPKKLIYFAMTALLLISCREKKGETSKEQGEVTTSTGKPVQVDPQADNKMVLKRLQPGIAFQLVVTDDEVKLEDLFIGRLPAPDSKKEATGELEISAVGAGKTIATTKVVDDPLMVQEDVGLVRLKERRVFGILYTPEKADSLVIRRAEKQEQKFDLKDYYMKFCREYPKDSLCR